MLGHKSQIFYEVMIILKDEQVRVCAAVYSLNCRVICPIKYGVADWASLALKLKGLTALFA